MEKGYSLYVDGTIPKPTNAKELINWQQQDQQALGAIRNCVHRDLFFHIASCMESKPAWDKLVALYGKVDEEKGFQIEDDLLLLEPKNFDTIQDYITKPNEYRELLNDCGNPMKDEKLIHHILKRLPSEYASFVSSYNTHRVTMGSAYQKHTFDAFIEILIVEQSHLMDLGLLTISKTKALVASDENQSRMKNF